MIREAILAMLVLLALFSIATRDLLKAVIGLSAFSLLSALLFFLLHAPDVALTEAAVGTGVSTFVFVWAIRKTGRRTDRKENS